MKSQGCGASKQTVPVLFKEVGLVLKGPAKFMEEKFPGNINTEKHQKNSLLSTAHILLSANYIMTAPSGSQGNRELLGALGSEDCETTTTKKHNLIPAKHKICKKESEKVEKHPDGKREISTYFYYYYHYY